MDAKTFRRIREAAGASAQALADWLRVDLRSVQKWEYGERRVSGPVSKLMEQLAASGEPLAVLAAIESEASGSGKDRHRKQRK